MHNKYLTSFVRRAVLKFQKTPIMQIFWLYLLFYAPAAQANTIEPNVYVIGSDGHLWANYLVHTQSTSHWVDYGAVPAPTKVPGVTLHRQKYYTAHNFILGGDGKVYLEDILNNSPSWNNEWDISGQCFVGGTYFRSGKPLSDHYEDLTRLFAVAKDGSVTVIYDNPDGVWSVSSLGKPNSSVECGTGLALTFDEKGVKPHPGIMVRRQLDGHILNLWWTGNQWQWNDRGKPRSGGEITSAVGSLITSNRKDVEFYNNTRLNEQPHFFYTASDKHLWVLYGTADASQWAWFDLEAPNSVQVLSGLGALDNGWGKNPHAFVLGSDTNVWAKYLDGGVWHWHNMGRPPKDSHGNEIKLVGRVGTLGNCDVMYSGDIQGSYCFNARTSYLFVIGSDKHLWMLWLSGGRWLWRDLGTPGPYVDVVSGVGAIADYSEFRKDYKERQ